MLAHLHECARHRAFVQELLISIFKVKWIFFKVFLHDINDPIGLNNTNMD